MLDEYEFYQGVVLRQIIAHSDSAIRIAPFRKSGRLNAFLLNDKIGVFVKHSAKRLSPWQFTFLTDHRDEIHELEAASVDSYIAFVCGTDGVALMTTEALRQLINFNSENVEWVRVDRSRRSMYGVHGPSGALPHKLAAGTGLILAALQNEVAG